MLLLAAALAASPPITDTRATPVYPMTCSTFFIPTGKGTVFRVKDRIVTAAHVWDTGKCRPKGSDKRSVRMERHLDYVDIIDKDLAAARYEVACEPFSPNRHYVAAGFPGASRQLTEIRIRNTGYYPKIIYPKTNQEIIKLWQFAGVDGGRAAPGMSGGPVLNDEGKVVGIILAYDPTGWGTYVRSVMDTPLCKVAYPVVAQDDNVSSGNGNAE